MDMSAAQMLDPLQVLMGCPTSHRKPGSMSPRKLKVETGGPDGEGGQVVGGWDSAGKQIFGTLESQTWNILRESWKSFGNLTGAWQDEAACQSGGTRHNLAF